MSQYKTTLSVNGQTYYYYDLKELPDPALERLPFSLKILLENQLRYLDGNTVTQADVAAFSQWMMTKTSQHEIAYRPARVLMQDFTGVPAVVDLAAMRDAMTDMGGETKKINPLCTADLVIDHSVQVDEFGTPHAFIDNVDTEMQRNNERYRFLKWGQLAFSDFRVVPPGTGICHQVNLEYLAEVAWKKEINGELTVYPDTLVGTDSHTTMINGLGVLGWGVGGIEAEAAMLGQPVSMLIPEVVGVRLIGSLNDGITATDLVLEIVNVLRKKGVVDKFVEFFGPGLANLPLADRATIANMAPEYGATCGFFPVDNKTLEYLTLSGRSQENIELVKAYTQAQGLWLDHENPQEKDFTDTLVVNLSLVVANVAGPKRPQDKVAITHLKPCMEEIIQKLNGADALTKGFSAGNFDMHHGDVVIAAITSCTNTSNPSVMVAAGLVAKKATQLGITVKPWVKTSLAPGSKVVTDYLIATDLMPHLEALGFYLVGYGCTTCIGNSGPLQAPISQAIEKNDLTVCGVLSGNRNFEGRIHPLVKTNWLASPPLVVAFALAGTTRINLTTEPLGKTPGGKLVYLKDVWPTQQEVATEVMKIKSDMFKAQYASVFDGTQAWQAIDVKATDTYGWDDASTYVRNPPYFEGMAEKPTPITMVHGARILAKLGDSVTTDHISPAGSIKADSPAGKYLQDHGIAIKDFNSYGSRRGNHEVMMRGTFANIRIHNEMCPGVEGGFTTHHPTGNQLSIYDAAIRYQKENVPLIIVAGKEYGTGSSRDWAAKGTNLLGVKVVITESFERIHRSNLIGMGVMPLQFPAGTDRNTLKLDGSETVTVELSDSMKPSEQIKVTFMRKNGETLQILALSRIDTSNELEYYRHGGILCYVLRNMLKESFSRNSQ
jgi:aconitate hydratase